MEKNDQRIVDLYRAEQDAIGAKAEVDRRVLQFLDEALGPDERMALVPDAVTARKIAEAGDDPEKVARCLANQALAENVEIHYADGDGLVRTMRMSALLREPVLGKVALEGYTLKGEKVTCEASRVQNVDEILMFLRYAHTEND